MPTAKAKSFQFGTAASTRSTPAQPRQGANLSDMRRTVQASAQHQNILFRALPEAGL